MNNFTNMNTKPREVSTTLLEVNGTEHSPGPWVPVYNAESDYVGIYSQGEKWLATVADLACDGRHLANARLISMAPCMLEILRSCDQVLRDLDAGKTSGLYDDAVTELSELMQELEGVDTDG